MCFSLKSKVFKQHLKYMIGRLIFVQLPTQADSFHSLDKKQGKNKQKILTLTYRWKLVIRKQWNGDRFLSLFILLFLLNFKCHLCNNYKLQNYLRIFLIKKMKDDNYFIISQFFKLKNNIIHIDKIIYKYKNQIKVC